MDVRQPKGREIYKVAESIGVKSFKNNGNDVERVAEETRSHVEMIKRGEGPIFAEYETYRWREHCGPNYDNDIGYRREAEYEEWKRRDPIMNYQIQISKKLDAQEISKMDAEIQEAFRQAKDDKYPEQVDARKNVYAPMIEDRLEGDNSDRVITFAEAILEGHRQTLQLKGETYVMGLGVPDPKGIFGTTKNLQSEFGENRIFDTPLAEHAVTGIAIGSAITGMRPVLTHQRLDFALVSIDQIVNQAAKWRYMFNGAMDVPIVIRMIIGRGWGQGPQHSQSLHAWFAHIPGLKVLIPSTPYEAKGMLIGAIEDNNPTIIIEHRWLHGTKGKVPTRYYKTPTKGAKVVRKGECITIIGLGYNIIECITAAKQMEEMNIKAEVIDVRVINPLDESIIIESIKKTGKALIVDDGHSSCGIASEIMARISEKETCNERWEVKRLTAPNYPCPTSYGLTHEYYPTAEKIIVQSFKMLGRQSDEKLLRITGNKYKHIHHDQPNPNFTGPF
tara:strand:+ start:21 stop:1532 length:1512 start_codon:yes stop_codon:yes gene_type:complete